MTKYDFVIVGGGSAGSALAARLSADPMNKVLVLEAGRPDYPWDVFIHMPAALTFPIGSRFYDWKYESEPEPHMFGRRIYHARGKVLGGSSSINAMAYVRGHQLCFDRWAAQSGPMWSYGELLRRFRRLEDNSRGASDYHGAGGPLAVADTTDPHAGHQAFLEAARLFPPLYERPLGKDEVLSTTTRLGDTLDCHRIWSTILTQMIVAVRKCRR